MLTVYTSGASVEVIDRAGTVPMPTVAVQQKTLNLARLVVFDDYHQSSRYERFQRLTVLKGNSATLGFRATDLSGGGANIALLGTSYSLLVDGQVAATVTVAAGALRGTFALDVTKIADGWRKIEIAVPAGESNPVWFVYVLRGSLPAQTTMPVYGGSYDLTHTGGSTQSWAMVPVGVAPTARPLPPREHPYFATADSYTTLYRSNTVPQTDGNIFRPNVDVNGIVCTQNEQAYFWGSFIAKFPKQHQLDGPRGVGMVSMATHFQVGRKGSAYFCTPWRFGKIAEDGTVQTIAGWRHLSPPSHWEGPQILALVGDWSAVPNPGFHELWGMAWRPSTLVTDPNAPPIGGEQPHSIGPELFFADTQNKRILRGKFSPTDRRVPIIMTEFLTGLADPWDCVCVGEVLYVSERTAHRIAAYDAGTGAFLRVLISGAALATVDVNRMVVRSATLPTIQAQPCVAPEGLFVQDDWLYFGSVAMSQVKKINLTTGEVRVACAPTIDGNSRYLKIALSDGTFGPRGTVFTSTWSNANFGHPQAFLPDGTQWSWYNYGPMPQGPGGRWDAAGYPTGVGVGIGRLYCGSSYEGVLAYSKALPTDVPRDEAKYTAGRAQWWAKGYAMIHGEFTFGPFGLPLPAGETPEIDYFLGKNA